MYLLFKELNLMKGFLLGPERGTTRLPEAAENLEDEVRTRPHPRADPVNLADTQRTSQAFGGRRPEGYS